MTTAIAPVRPATSLDDLALDINNVNHMRRKGRDLIVYDVKALAAAERIPVREARRAILIECNDRLESPKGVDIGQGRRPEDMITKIAIYHKGLRQDAPTSAYERYVIVPSTDAYFAAHLNEL